MCNAAAARARVWEGTGRANLRHDHGDGRTTVARGGQATEAHRGFTYAHSVQDPVVDGGRERLRAVRLTEDGEVGAAAVAVRGLACWRVNGIGGGVATGGE